MIRVFVALLFVCVFPGLSYAKSGDLAVGIASNHIDITVGFNGSSIELFGDRRDKDSIVAIVVEGPRQKVTLWKKARIMGAWINRYSAVFQDLPLYYHYAITADEIDGDLRQLLIENGIGHDGLFHSVMDKGLRQLKNLEDFQDALVKKGAEQGLFFETPAELKFLNENFFRVSFDIPASAPTGQYKIYSYLIKNDKVIDKTLDLLKVEQVGLNAFVYNAAQDYGFIYALVCIFLALFAGWFVSVLKVKP